MDAIPDRPSGRAPDAMRAALFECVRSVCAAHPFDASVARAVVTLVHRHPDAFGLIPL